MTRLSKDFKNEQKTATLQPKTFSKCVVLDKEIFKKPTAGLENPDLTGAKEVAGKYVRDELNQAFLKLMSTMKPIDSSTACLVV